MANKPLKTIRFPGIDNVYTIPSKTSDLTNDSGFLTSHSTWYGTSSTAASTAAKVVTCSGFALSTGALIGILFSTANTAATPTLNVNSTGAKSIYVGASSPSATTNVLKWSANTMLYFQYDGTYFRFITSVSAGDVIPLSGANTWYGMNSVAAATAAKTAAIDNFVLTKGAMVSIVSTTANTTAAPTLNVNSTGAIAIYYNNAVTSSSNQLLWNANDILNFMYDGTYWRFLGKAVTKTSQLTNDSGFITSAPVTSVNGQTGAVTGLQTTSNLVTSMSSSSTNAQYPSAKAVYDALEAAGEIEWVEIGSTISDARWNEIVAAVQAGKIVMGYYDYEESPGPIVS